MSQRIRFAPSPRAVTAARGLLPNGAGLGVGSCGSSEHLKTLSQPRLSRLFGEAAWLHRASPPGGRKQHKPEHFELSCQGSVRTEGHAALPPSSPSPLAGSPHRCLHALKVGWKVCWAKAEEEEEQRRMAFLSHDISMLRLFETFLENTPQLTLLLYVILQTNKAEPSQGEGSGARAGGCGGPGLRSERAWKGQTRWAVWGLQDPGGHCSSVLA